MVFFTFTLEDFLTLDCDIREYIIDLLFQLKKKTLWKERLFIGYGKNVPYEYGTVTEDIVGVNQHILRKNITISYRWWNGIITKAHNTLLTQYVWADDNRWRPYIMEYDGKKSYSHCVRGAYSRGGGTIKYLDE